jgi:hypothetical protein
MIEELVYAEEHSWLAGFILKHIPGLYFTTHILKFYGY